MKLIILGAGYSLLPLISRLEPGSVVVTVNSPDKLEKLKKRGVNVALLNLADRAGIETFFKAHSDAHTLIDGVPPLRDGQFPASFGVQNVIASLPLLPKLKRVFYLSSTGVYGVRDGSWVDEQTPARPVEEKARARLSCELLYQNTPCEVTGFRISGIYGPGRGPGNPSGHGERKIVGDRWSNRIHVEDLREIIVRALKYDKILPPILNVSDNEPALSKEVFDFFAAKFKVGEFSYITLEEALASGRTSHLQNQRVSNRLVLQCLQLELTYPSYKEGVFACDLPLKKPLSKS